MSSFSFNKRNNSELKLSQSKKKEDKIINPFNNKRNSAETVLPLLNIKQSRDVKKSNNPANILFHSYTSINLIPDACVELLINIHI